MHIGILTFLNANNYGAVLQAFSLYNKLIEMGHDTEMIDYRSPAIEAAHSFSFRSHKGIKAKLKGLLRNLSMRSRRNKFELFRKKIRKSCVYNPQNISEANEQYDIFITGSDQVFNFDLTGHDQTYFLDFVELNNKKVAYAASMGRFIESEKDNYKHLLSDFYHLSVREKSTAEQIEGKLGIECSVVPDPVFLHNAFEWKQFVNNGDVNTFGDYVLIYSLFETVELYKEAKKFANQNRCKIVVITKSLRPSGKADVFIRDAGPEDFLGLIMNAKYVVTDSFHGTAFSLIFNKQLKIVMPPKAQNRILDLLAELGVQLGFSSIDYELVNKKLDAYRNRGIDFLKRI